MQMIKEAYRQLTVSGAAFSPTLFEFMEMDKIVFAEAIRRGLAQNGMFIQSIRQPGHSG